MSRVFSRRIQVAQAEQNEDQWIISYADMISAILVVVMLMFSFTKLDLVKIDSLQRANTQDIKVESLEVIAQKLQMVSDQQGLEHELKIEIDEDGVTLHFQNVAWFKTGRSEINTGALEKLNPIFKVVAQASKDRRIDIEGHTDDVLGVGAKETLNWELSSERSLALFKYLKSFDINDREIRLVAYADTKPFENINGLEGDALEQARSQNRRVSIFIGELK